MFDYRLALMTGVDIPLMELQTVVHQPTMKEISMIGEKDFFIGVQLLCIDKNQCIQDEQVLQKTNNFQVFNTIINDQSMADKKQSVIQLLTLLFPNIKINFTPRAILLNQGERDFIIDEENFQSFQNLLSQMFCLSKSDSDSFNPQSEKAKEIAQKLMRARQIIAQQKAKENSGSVFSQYLSTLIIGVGSVTPSEAMDLTVYQLYDLMERYNLYVNWDIDIRSRMAGAKNDKPIESWMKQIHH